MVVTELELNRGKETLYLSKGIHFGENKPRLIKDNDTLLDEFRRAGKILKTKSGNYIDSGKRIYEIMGINTREVFPGNSYQEVIMEMAAESVSEVLQYEDPNKIDFLIGTTTYPEVFDSQLPLKNNLSEALKKKLKLPEKIVCKDFYAGCPGVLWALNAIKQNEEIAMGKRFILFAAEAHTWNFDDPFHYFIFSEKSVAMGATYGKDIIILASNVEYDEENDGPISLPINPLFLPDYEFPVPISDKFRMQGTIVQRFIFEKAPEIIDKTINDAGLTIEDIDLILAHQGNGKSVAGLGKKYPGKVHYFADNGNAASGSALLTGKDAWEKGLIGPGSTIAIGSWGPKNSRGCTVGKLL